MPESSVPVYSRIRKKITLYSFEIVILLTLHACLLHYMHNNNIVSTIFAGGGHVPWSTSGLAILFITVRLMTVLALPGILLTRLGLIFLEIYNVRIAAQSKEENHE